MRGNKGAKSYNVQQAAARGEKKRDDKEAEETPGELVTLPSGIQYREILTGGGAEAVEGTTCEMMYVCTTSQTVTLQRCTLDKLWDAGIGILSTGSPQERTTNTVVGASPYTSGQPATGLRGKMMWVRRTASLSGRGVTYP